MSTRHMKKMCTILLIISAMIGIGVVTVCGENIDPDNDDSQYAYGENVGYLNFEPSGNGGPGAEVTNSAVTGYVWGENIGWINLIPVSYGVVANDGAGNLSGYAWGENVGWINFAPTGGGVTIGSDGVFDGWAWGENIGWIHLKNLAIPYKVKTAWAPLSTTPVPSPTPTVGASPTPTPTVEGLLGSISGYVVDIKDNPIESVKLRLKGPNAVKVIKDITDADGYFEFTDLEAGTYVITATNKGYKSVKQTITLEEGEDREIEIVMKKKGKGK